MDSNLFYSSPTTLNVKLIQNNSAKQTTIKKKKKKNLPRNIQNTVWPNIWTLSQASWHIKLIITILWIDGGNTFISLYGIWQIHPSEQRTISANL